MDLKDVILSTIAELEKDAISQPKEPQKITSPEESESIKHTLDTKALDTYKKGNEDAIFEAKSLQDERKYEDMKAQEETKRVEPVGSSQNELMFLTSLRERILVLFEGMQSPNNKNIEAKLDMILNFLEYQLSVIDDRLDTLAGR